MDRRTFTRTMAGAAGAWSLGVPSASGRGSKSPEVRVDGDRINANLATLSQFGKNPYGGVSRVAYSQFDKDGRAFAMQLMAEAQLKVEIDVAGNILGRRAGKDPGLKPIVFGSHIDSVPDGGNYDGDVGSLSAIEVARTLHANGIVTRHPLEVVIFQNEEGGTVGSRAITEGLTASDLALVTKSGKTIGDGIGFIGGDPSKLAAGVRARGDIAAYVELHIEQGGTLDAQQLDIGVVEGIVGIGWWDVTIEGFANHAGTTAMHARKDAMLAAARFTELVNRVITSEPGRQVGTVGRLQAFPGAPNVIPGKVVLSLEVRELDAGRIDRFYRRIRTEAEAIGKATGCTFSYEPTHQSSPAICDPRVMQAIAGAARNIGLTTKYLPSGAGHDAQHMAKIGPAGMIFVPSVGGISHSPNEFTEPADVVNGANVLLHTVLSLDAG
ncbi:MAG: N-carbamoyl-L-amino acid hydrolase [Gemmatimonadaceae bacterium]|nr:N-carbamoyl-L-amino acid hydrolase [Gemmatimonadaceae bacterium]